MNKLSDLNITTLLQSWSQGDQNAQEQLMRLVYDELRQIASKHLRQERTDVLQTTALVHEAYIKLVDLNKIHWENRTQFFALASKFMRRILIDFARARQAQRRGNGATPITIDDINLPVTVNFSTLLEIDELLRNLANLDSRQSCIVEMRVFGGMTNEEISEVLQVSARTIRREWIVARAWLINELNLSTTPASPCPPD
jgi:RNA polymerase sigma factor (TIGR02999 family)